ncbi:hypothetical protein CBS101457_006210 [Exobasidium rhododendri]|nr:hypothetical protein CBS101457_006210 [Exobasidium rhododendri]
MDSFTGHRVIYLAPTVSQLDARQSVRPIKYSRSAQSRSMEKVFSSEEPGPRSEMKRSRAEREDTNKERSIPLSFKAARCANITPRYRASRKLKEGKARGGTGFGDALKAGAILSVSNKSIRFQSESELGSRRRPSSQDTSVTDERSFDVQDTDASIGSEEDHVIPLVEQEHFVTPKLISKKEHLRLGPARVVGLRRMAADSSPLLKAFVRPTARAAEVVPASTEAAPTSVSTSFSRGSEVRSVDENSMGATTVESIPPPPTHEFSLSHLTSIADLLSSPNRFLSSHHGGNQFESALKFNVLALVMRVGGLEDAPDWKAGGGKRMDRCEVVVKDASECALKVVLEGDCATQWATPREGGATLNDEESHSTESSANDQGQHSDISSEAYCNSLEASISALQDDNTSASRTTIERQRDQRLLPLRPGDVVVLFRLCLVRPKEQKQWRGLPSSRTGDPNAVSTHAIASPSAYARLEICWRNAVYEGRDERRNFDKCLTLFDARCKAIYRLAQAWTSNE